MREPSEWTVCAVCRRPLNEVVVDDEVVEWEHPPVMFGGPAHDPVPVRASEVENEAVIVCDFCSGRDVEWRYPTSTFVISADHGSADDWLACDLCHRLIEAGRWRQLANRALDAIGVPDIVRRQARPKIMGLHEQFVAHRDGPAIRIYGD